MRSEIIAGLTLFFAALTIIILCGTVPSDAEYYADGDFDYDIDEEGATLLLYRNTTTTELIIPDTVNYNDTDYPIVAISCNSLPNNIEKVTIPAYVMTVVSPIYNNDSRLNEICVSPYNLFFSISYGALIDDYDKQVVAYPPANPNTEFCLNTILSIGPSAFSGAKNLVQVTLPVSTTVIQNGTFEKCTNLKYINYSYGDTENTMPESLMVIDNYAFYGCTSLEKIRLNDNARMIAYGAFFGCTALKSIYIGTNISMIDRGAFENCSSLVDISVGEGNRLYAVADDEMYKGILMRLGISGERCIAIYPGGYDRETLTIDDNITAVDPYAFSFGYGKLKNIVIDKKYNIINNCAFYNCKSLETIILNHSVTSIGESSFGLCTSLRSINLGNELISIGESAFVGCQSMTGIVLPESLKYIGELAFANSGLKDIILHENVVAIRSFAFFHSDLSEVTIYGAPTIEADAFNIEGKLHITKQLNFELPADAFGEDTDVSYDNFDEWKFPMYNIIGIIVCVLILIGMILLFRRI